MSFEEILRKKDISIRDLQQFQEEYDKKFVDEKFTGFEKVRHTSLHLAKLLGKLAGYCEKMEEGVSMGSEQLENEVIPDLIVYALWLAREFNINPDEAYLKRMINNIERIYSHKSSQNEREEFKRLLDERVNIK